jgi:sugar lactone lactonase YvrE
VTIGSTSAPQITRPLSVDPYIPTTVGPATFTMACAPAGSGVVTYSFDFGDGSPQQTNSTGVATHAYSAAKAGAQYTVRSACGQGLGDQVNTLTVSAREPKMRLLQGSPGGFDVYRVAVDSAGNVYLSERRGSRGLLKITPAGNVITIPIENARALAADGLGNIYVASHGGSPGAVGAVRKISPEGVVTLWAPYFTSMTADADGNLYGITDGVTVAERLIQKISPNGILSTLVDPAVTPEFRISDRYSYEYTLDQSLAIDGAGTLYVSGADGGLEGLNAGLRKVSASGEVSHFVTTQPISGQIAIGHDGNLYVTRSSAVVKIRPSGQIDDWIGGVEYFDELRTESPFGQLRGVAIDFRGNVYVADGGHNSVRKITPVGSVNTIAGGSYSRWIIMDYDAYPAVGMQRNGLSLDRQGNVYWADTSRNVIRKLSLTGQGSIVAGSGISGGIDATGVAARFSSPSGVAVDDAGQLYVADRGNRAIRKISAGVVTTLATDLAVDAIAVDRVGNVYVAGYRISASGVVSPFPTTNARAIAVASNGNVYMVEPSGTDGGCEVKVVTLAGSITTLAVLPPSSVYIGVCHGLAVDSAGNSYVTHAHAQVIYKVTLAGVVSVVAGTNRAESGPADFRMDGLPGSFDYPFGIAISGRRLVFSGANYLAQIYFTP